MSAPRRPVGAGLLLVLLCLAPAPASAQWQPNAIAQWPLVFERNEGQSPAGVRFVARSAGYAVLLTDAEAVIRLSGSGDIRLALIGASPSNPLGDERLPTTINYVRGRDPALWRTAVPSFARVRYPGVYPGIDLVYHGQHGTLEYDFVVAPGADPEAIRMTLAGQSATELDGDGHLRLHTAGGTLRFERPILYQETAAGRQTVNGGFRVLPAGEIGFHVGAYDETRPLVIDPVLAYSTYLGGSVSTALDVAQGIDVDGSGAAYIVGYTTSVDFPLNSPWQPDYGLLDTFVAKLSPDGTALVFATFLGGAGEDYGAGLAVADDGSVYVVGRTRSEDFPILSAVQADLRGGYDTFVSRLAPDGSDLLFSTLLGGTGADDGRAVAVDDLGRAYVVGTTASADFPTSVPFQLQLAGAEDAFLARYSAAGALEFSSFLGGPGGENGNAVAVGAGAVFVAGSSSPFGFPVTAGAAQPGGGGGWDGFVTRFSTANMALAYSTRHGGDRDDEIAAVAVDAAGAAYVTGTTRSATFPVTNGAFQMSNPDGSGAFVTKLRPDGSSVEYSTLLGGGGLDQGWAIAVDTVGRATVVGSTASHDFPIVQGQQVVGIDLSGGRPDAFVTTVHQSGASLVYSTYLGGDGSDRAYGIALDAAGYAYVAGETGSVAFPTTAGALQPLKGKNVDAFVVRIDAGPASCSYAVRPAAILLAGPTDRLISVTAPSGCEWAAVSTADWLVLDAPTTGSGIGIVSFEAEWNEGPTRQATIAIGDQTVVVTQPSRACTYEMPAIPAQPSAGSEVVVTLTTQQGCPWTFLTEYSWLHGAPESGVGSADLRIRFEPNVQSEPREGTFRFGNNLWHVRQATACAFGLNGLTDETIPAVGGAGTFFVETSRPDCPVEVRTSGNWMSLDPLFASGDTQVRYTVGPNTSASARSTTIRVSDFSPLVTVSQPGLPLSNIPTVLPPSPASGSGFTQTFTFTFHDWNGVANLDVLNVLISEYLDGRSGCYIAYVPSLNVVYLVDDPGTALLPALPLNGALNSVGNSQCVIASNGSSVQTSQFVLTLRLRITFTPQFAGSKSVYQAARDAQALNSGWVQQGVWNVPGERTSPSVVSMETTRGGGTAYPFQFVFADDDGFGDLVSTTVLVNSALDGAGACYLGYHVPSNTVLLLDDAGTAYLPPLVLGTAGVAENSQCRINGLDSKAIAADSQLTLTLSMEFKARFSGGRVFYLSAQDGSATSGWKAMGTWTVP